jgi:hypothetical protein
VQDGRPPDERGAANSISWTVKLKPYEVLASALAAVAAAAAASFFGVKGTLVGAAIGSAVATSVAALIKQSADRAQEAMKKSGLASITSSLTRRSTATSSVEDVDASEKSQVPPEARAGVVGREPRATDPSSETDHWVVAGIGDPTEPVFEEPTVQVPAPRATEPTIVGSGSKQGAAGTTQPTPVGQTAMFERPGAAPHKRLRTAIVVTASALAAFVLAILVVTLIELGAGRSLSSIFGGPKSGSTVGGVFNGVTPSATTTTVPSPTSTTSSSSTTTASTTSTTSTTTTAPGSTTSEPLQTPSTTALTVP